MIRRTMCSLAIVAGLAGSALGQDIAGLRYIGQSIIPTGATFAGTQVGGLSGIDYDPASGSYYAISDDRSATSPARFYNLSFAFDQNSVSGVTFNSVTTLLRPDGTTFPTNQVDPEAIRLDRSTGRFFWSSEGERVLGNPQSLQNPFVREMNVDGSFSRELSTPSRYNPTTGNFGIQRNLAFESLTLSADGNTVYTATENSLFQDGPAAGIGIASPSRVLSFNKATGASGAEYVYLTDPVVADPTPPGSFATNGLVELLALTDTTFLAVERSFSTGVGNSIRIYKASISGATDVSAFDALPVSYTAMTKELLYDLDDAGILLDNIEGISLGPILPNGNRSVVLVADNNFAASQFTQFIALEVIPAPGTAAVLGLLGVAALRRRR
ncbi:MAG: esterase-like activity of phytase family protein [Pyrinomonadaceae bacterium]|nr:esterase-like activity of phytase family protein [Phycisphaerales bacterium]